MAQSIVDIISTHLTMLFKILVCKEAKVVFAEYAPIPSARKGYFTRHICPAPSKYLLYKDSLITWLADDLPQRTEAESLSLNLHANRSSDTGARHKPQKLSPCTPAG
jgi:hypothetical protein